MDNKIKRIYLYMIDSMKHWPWHASGKKVSKELKKQGIRTTQAWEDSKGKITGGAWYKTKDGVRQNWFEGYADTIYEVSDRIKAIKADITVTDKIKEVAVILTAVFKDPFDGNDIVPMRDRPRTKGVFRRTDDVQIG